MYKEAIEVMELAHGKNNPDIARILKDLGDFLTAKVCSVIRSILRLFSLAVYGFQRILRRC